MTAVPGHAPPAATRPSAAEIQSLDSCAFLAVFGKHIIHPGGRRSTQQRLELASLAAGQQVLDIGCGVATTTIQVAQRFNARDRADLAPLMLARANRTPILPHGCTCRCGPSKSRVLAARQTRARNRTDLAARHLERQRREGR